MDAYDQYKALQGGSDRINKLNSYIALYEKLGMGGANPQGSATNSWGLGGYNNAQLTPSQQARNAMDWATRQVDSESIQNQRSQNHMPNFFGQGGSQPSYQPAQYTQPQQFSEPNPYAGNAQAIGTGMTNNLLKLLQGSGTGFRMGGTTGVRG